MKNIKLKKCKNCKGTGMVQIAEGKKGLVACPVCKLEMTVGTLRTFSNEQAICIERLEKENRAEKENNNYVVYVKKLFFLKHGIKKISVSRYKYKTLPGARRRCKLMNSRQDVIECYIN